MLTIPVYNAEGVAQADESIDPSTFGVSINKQLLHDVVLMHLANRRVGTVNTRGRADVAGSSKKLFRQKGTGNARAGAKRTNKRRGGGVAFARRNRDYSYAIPKKAVRMAIRMALLSKFQDRQALVLDMDFRQLLTTYHQENQLGTETLRPKTSLIAEILRRLPRPDHDPLAAAATEAGTEAQAGEVADENGNDGEAPVAEGTAVADVLYGQTILIGLDDYDPLLYRSARNIEGVQVMPVSEFNTYDVLRQRYLVLTRPALEALKARYHGEIRRRPARPMPALAVGTAAS